MKMYDELQTRCSRQVSPEISLEMIWGGATSLPYNLALFTFLLTFLRLSAIPSVRTDEECPKPRVSSLLQKS